MHPRNLQPAIPGLGSGFLVPALISAEQSEIKSADAS